MNIWLLYFFVQLDFCVGVCLIFEVPPCLLFPGQLKVTNLFHLSVWSPGVTGMSLPCLDFSRVVILSPSESEQGAWYLFFG